MSCHLTFQKTYFFFPLQTIAKYHYGLCSFCEIPEKSATHLRLDVYHKQASGPLLSACRAWPIWQHWAVALFLAKQSFREAKNKSIGRNCPYIRLKKVMSVWNFPVGREPFLNYSGCLCRHIECPSLTLFSLGSSAFTQETNCGDTVNSFEKTHSNYRLFIEVQFMSWTFLWNF